MLNPKSYYIKVDNGTTESNKKYPLSEANGNMLYINPLKYGITSSSTVTLGRYFDTKEKADNTTITLNSSQSTDFPQYGCFPLNTSRILGSLIRSTSANYNWNLSLSAIDLSSETEGLLGKINYTCFYRISLADILAMGIYEIIFTFEGDVSSVLYRTLNATTYPTITSSTVDNVKTYSIQNTFSENTGWRYITNNLIVLKTFNDESYWEYNNNNSRYSIIGNQSALYDYDLDILTTNNFYRYLANNIYIKCLDNISLTIKKIEFKKDFSKFTRNSPIYAISFRPSSLGLEIPIYRKMEYQGQVPMMQMGTYTLPTNDFIYNLPILKTEVIRDAFSNQITYITVPQFNDSFLRCQKNNNNISAIYRARNELDSSYLDESKTNFYFSRIYLISDYTLFDIIQI